MEDVMVQCNLGPASSPLVAAERVPYPSLLLLLVSLRLRATYGEWGVSDMRSSGPPSFGA
eukprot:7244697-Pyramimonas_sp.AAC.1